MPHYQLRFLLSRLARRGHIPFSGYSWNENTILIWNRIDLTPSPTWLTATREVLEINSGVKSIQIYRANIASQNIFKEFGFDTFFTATNVDRPGTYIMRSTATVGTDILSWCGGVSALIGLCFPRLFQVSFLAANPSRTLHYGTFVCPYL